MRTNEPYLNITPSGYGHVKCTTTFRGKQIVREYAINDTIQTVLNGQYTKGYVTCRMNLIRTIRADYLTYK